MARRDFAAVLISMPPPLKQRVVAIAAAEGSNLNDVIVGMLAKKYGVRFKPSGRKSSSRDDKLKVLVRMPDQLKLELQRHAVELRTNLTELIVISLATTFNVPIDAVPSARTSPFGGGRGRFRTRRRRGWWTRRRWSELAHDR
jgi:hypothetical protein